MVALGAHTSVSTRALNSDAIHREIKDILLNKAGMYETLLDKARTPQLWITRG